MTDAPAKRIRMQYESEPTATDFHACDDFVRAIMGPLGSGKSVAMCWEIVMRANTQKAHKGVRRSRWAAVRNSCPQLKSTTIKTWTQWFPESIFPIRYDSPITCKAHYPLPDGTKVELEVVFIALDQPRDVKKLLSLELTGVWFNECRELSKALLDQATGRVGRFPSPAMGGASWTGIIMDTNPPDTDHWFYKLFEVERPLGYRLFRQPTALVGNDPNNLRPNPDAENIRNLAQVDAYKGDGYAYYTQQLGGKTMEWIRVYVQGQYGTTFDGKPVYPEYDDQFHASRAPLEPMRGIPLIIGLDFGLTPAAAFGQLHPTGRLVLLDEIATYDMGFRRMIDTALKPKLAARFQGMTLQIYGDPAGSHRVQTDEKTCYEILRECGLQGQPVSTNEFITRREFLAKYMQMRIDGGPGFQIDAMNCPTIRAGMMGKYILRRVQVSGDDRFKDEPEKNHYSHCCEAAQYLAMSATPATARPDAVVGVTSQRKRVVAANPAGWT